MSDAPENTTPEPQPEPTPEPQGGGEPPKDLLDAAGDAGQPEPRPEPEKSEGEGEGEGEGEEPKASPDDYLDVEIEGVEKEVVRELLEREDVGALRELAAKYGMAKEDFAALVKTGLEALARDLVPDVEQELRRLGPKATERIGRVKSLVESAVGLDHPFAKLVFSTADGIEFVERLTADHTAATAGLGGARTETVETIQGKLREIMARPDYWQRPDLHEEVRQLIAKREKLRATLGRQPG